MPTHHVNSHAIEAARIVSVEPLLAQGKILSPEAGLTLVLENGAKHKWLSEKAGSAPSMGDFLIKDDELSVIYFVTANKFSTLFRETSGKV
jgi:hypothetical protein